MRAVAVTACRSRRLALDGLAEGRVLRTHPRGLTLLAGAILTSDAARWPPRCGSWGWARHPSAPPLPPVQPQHLVEPQAGMASVAPAAEPPGPARSHRGRA